MIPRVLANYSFADFLRASLAAVSSDGCAPLIAELRRESTAKYALLVPSARAGLLFLFKGLDRKRVICPAYTCNAVVDAIQRAGMTIDHVPLASSGFNASTDAVAMKAGPDAIILMTHQFGQITDVDEYRRIAENSGALLIEDGAAAHGGNWRGSPVGSNGLASVISFENSKILHGPLHAGAIFTSDDALFSKLEWLVGAETKKPGWVSATKSWLAAGFYPLLRSRSLYKLFHFLHFKMRNRDSAEEPQELDEHDTRYFNRMLSWQAHLLIAQMQEIEANTKRRRAVFHQYWSRLDKLNVSRMPDQLRDGDACARFSFTSDLDRSEVLDIARTRGIDLGVAFSSIEAPHSFSEEQRVASSILNLPLYPQLSDRDITLVLGFLDEVLGESER